MSLTIYGASDDLVEIEGHVSGAIGCYDRPIMLKVGDNDSGGLILTMEYLDATGCWAARVERIGEGIVIPWPAIVRSGGPGHLYTVVVDIDCPDDEPVEVLTDGGWAALSDEPWESK